jgi:hypothetical protein
MSSNPSTQLRAPSLHSYLKVDSVKKAFPAREGFFIFSTGEVNDSLIKTPEFDQSGAIIVLFECHHLAGNRRCKSDPNVK